MESSRPEKLGDLLREEISDMLRRKLRDPRFEFVTITGIVVTGDLRNARIFVSKLGEKDELDEAVGALNGAAGVMRGELGKRLTLRRVPELVFRPDTSIEYGARIERVLREIDEERKSRGGGTPEDKGGL